MCCLQRPHSNTLGAKPQKLACVGGLRVTEPPRGCPLLGGRPRVTHRGALQGLHTPATPIPQMKSEGSREAIPFPAPGKAMLTSEVPCRRKKVPVNPSEHIYLHGWDEMNILLFNHTGSFSR